MGSDGRATDGAAGEPGRSAPRIAVVDLGSNSTRLMVADVVDGDVRELARETRVTRLGRGVDLTGKLSDDGVEAVCAAVADFVATAHPLAPEKTVAIATSAVRDSVNGEAFTAELRERFSLSPRILDGDSEGRLTFAGATAGRLDDDDCVLVCDIGGGSTELIAGCGGEVQFGVSLDAGVVRQTERHISHDPPEPTELEALADEVRATLIEAISDGSPPQPDLGIAVAGTPTSLAAIDLGLEIYDPAMVHGHTLTMEAVQRQLSRLAAMPLAERFRVPGLQPERAPTIVAGVVILIQVMRAFGLGAIEVSEHDILHGAALEAAAAPVPGAARP